MRFSYYKDYQILLDIPNKRKKTISHIEDKLRKDRGTEWARLTSDLRQRAIIGMWSETKQHLLFDFITKE